MLDARRVETIVSLAAQFIADDVVDGRISSPERIESYRTLRDTLRDMLAAA